MNPKKSCNFSLLSNEEIASHQAAKRQEAVEKAAQTAELFLKDIQELYGKARGVAELDLFYGYIEQVARIKGTLGRIANENK